MVDGAHEAFEDVGEEGDEGGNDRIAASTLLHRNTVQHKYLNCVNADRSNSSWVMLDNEVWSIASMNCTAPIYQE